MTFCLSSTNTVGTVDGARNGKFVQKNHELSNIAEPYVFLYFGIQNDDGEIQICLDQMHKMV